MRLVVLRPEPGASATVGRAEAAGLEAFARPMFRVEPLNWTAPDPTEFDGVLVTSANAVRQAGCQLAALAALPAYAVGEATADAARAAGLTVAATGSAGVAALLAELPANLRLLHLSGVERTEAEPRQQVTVVPVYRSVPVEPAPDLAALAPAVLLVHSPAAGRRLAEVLKERSRFHVVAISPAAAAACGSGWASISAAPEPTDAALLSLAARLCQQSSPK